MEIKKFKKIGPNKYKLFYDDSYLIVYEEVIIKYNLLYKKEINDEMMIKIGEDNFKASIYDVALRYINIRMRSKKEIRDYLVKNKYDFNDINYVIEKLESQGILNDYNFCKSYVNDKIYLTNSGPDKIRNDLCKYGVDENIINEIFKSIDMSNLNNKLAKIINKEIKANSKLPIVKIRNKVINRCLNLGYKLSDINCILDDIELVSNSNIMADYNKIYKKYFNKYDDYKLKNVIKSKLYQKGYDLDEINRVIIE